MVDNNSTVDNETDTDTAPEGDMVRPIEGDCPGSEDSKGPELAFDEADAPPPRPIRSRENSAPSVSEAGEDEDETWTNQPSGNSKEDPGDGVDAAGSDDREDELEEEDEAPPVTRKAIQCGRDVVTEELAARAQRARDRLRPYLTGALVIELSNSGEKFLFDWRTDEAKITPCPPEVTLASADNTGPHAVECIISLTEQNLMAIRSGDLNPQVAMLADKIKVRGKMSPAVYLFNLVAPRMRPQ